MDKRQFQKLEIERFVETLGLDPETKRFAEVLVGSCDVCGCCKGRSTEALVSACVYLAVREHREPVSLKEITDIVSVSREAVFRAYQDIVDCLGIQLEPEEPIKYVDEFVSRLNATFDSNLGEDVVQTARELVLKSWGQGFSAGSSPTGIAAGAVYLAADIENKRVTQQEVAEIANVTPGTVRTNARTHRTFYENEPK